MNMDSHLQYNINELVQFMDQCNDNSYSSSYSGVNFEPSPNNFNYPIQYEQEIKNRYEQQKPSRQEIDSQHISAMTLLPIHASPDLHVLNLRDQEYKELQKSCRFSKTDDDVRPIALTELRETLNYDELFDTFINSEVEAQTLKESLEVLRLQSPVSLTHPLTPKATPINKMNNYKSKSYIFENQENQQETLYIMESDEIDVGRMYRYPNNSGRCFDIGTLKLLSNSYKEAKIISASVNKLIDDEFELNSKYFSSLENGFMKRQKTQSDEGKNKIRKRNNPSTDEVEWKPLSIFTVYTNFKPDAIDDTDYFENIPQSSCFGRLNMRVKRAWTRGPNKVKLK